MYDNYPYSHIPREKWIDLDPIYPGDLLYIKLTTGAEFLCEALTVDVMYGDEYVIDVGVADDDQIPFIDAAVIKTITPDEYDFISTSILGVELTTEVAFIDILIRFKKNEFEKLLKLDVDELKKYFKNRNAK